MTKQALIYALMATTSIWIAPTFSTCDETSESKIAWYATLDSGLAEAKRSNRPILLVSGAPQCLGVPGIW